MKFTITYTRTLVLEETVDASSAEEAKRHAEKRAWDSCELTNGEFDESNTEFSIENCIS